LQQVLNGPRNGDSDDLAVSIGPAVRIKELSVAALETLQALCRRHLERRGICTERRRTCRTTPVNGLREDQRHYQRYSEHKKRKTSRDPSDHAGVDVGPLVVSAWFLRHGRSLHRQLQFRALAWVPEKERFVCSSIEWATNDP
jgi:hypothetical protein